ncbi:MAG: hypothetical protein V1928_05180 [Parcubacteria group bacterium]
MRYASRLGKGRDGVKFKVNHRKMSDFAPPKQTDKKQNGKKKKGKKKEVENPESSE